MSAHTLNLCGVLSETKRIINAHSRHFLALSVLFLLPLSFSLVVYPFLSQSDSAISHRHRQSLFFNFLPESGIPPIDKSHLLLPILYGLFVLLFSLCATSSITYSTFHGFYGRPVKFVSSIKSVVFSFLPLIVTLIIIQIIVGLVIFAFGGFSYLLLQGFTLLGFEVYSDSVFFLVFVILIAAVVVGLLIFLQVEWYLSSVVVIVESQWGFSPLKRSSYLVKGMRRVALSMVLLFGVLFGLLATLCSSLVPKAGGISDKWVNWAFIFQTVVYTGSMTILMLYSVAANAVLFMYCKALHGELAFDIAQEFAQEYVRLPYDDGKVPHVVYVV